MERRIPGASVIREIGLVRRSEDSLEAFLTRLDNWRRLSTNVLQGNEGPAPITMNLTVRDAAQLLQVSEKTVYRWINQRTIPAYLISGQYRFNRAELLEWATSRRIQVSVDILTEPESSYAPCPGLVQALEAGGIFYRVEGHDRESALRAVVEVMRLPDEVDRDFLLRVLVAREALGSTGIGEGIAIPHVRNPIVLHLPQPSVTLCFLERAIDFGAIDGRPVQVLFTVISPTIRAHLYMMSRLAFALSDRGFKEAVLNEASRETIFGQARRVEAALVEPPAAQRTARHRPDGRISRRVR
jgi:nitrogen PTS system EIIA component